MSCPLHWRARLRSEIVSRLTGQTAAGARVYPERSLSFLLSRVADASEFPAIAVYVTDATGDMAGNTVQMSADVEVESYCAGLDEVATTTQRDSLSDAIYHALLERDFERFTVESIRDEPMVIQEGARTIAGQRFTLSVAFELCVEPRSPLVAFEGVDTETDLDKPDGPPDLEQAIELPQPESTP